MEYTIGTKVFGDWEIVREIGEGSYGKVFELHKSNFGVQAKGALKLIRIPKSVSEIKEALSEGMDEKTVTTYFEGIVQQFVKEIAIMTELKSHANIVSCEDYVVKEHEGTIGWDILIRMELLTPMQDYLTGNSMTEAMVRKLAVDMCEALVFIQKKGLIHRDIKPGNIFIDSMGNFKLGDFGVARTAEKTMGGMSKQGTENYMAPEVYYVRPYGASVDIYSLGIVLYRLMNNNRLPFYPQAPSPIRLSDRENALKRRMEGEQLPPPCNGSEEFVSIILKACKADSQKRYRTAGEMLAALRGADYLEENVQEEEGEPCIGVQSDLEGNYYINGKKIDVRHIEESDDDDGTVNPFDDKDSTAYPDPFDDKDSTINPFGDLSGYIDIGGETDSAEDRTINPFGEIPGRGGVRKDPIKVESINLDITKTLKFTLDNDPRGKTIDVDVDGIKVRVPVPAAFESGQTMRLNGLGRTNVVTGEEGNLLLTIEIDETKKEPLVRPDDAFKEKVKQYCKAHLTEMWTDKSMAKWQAYIAPDIPLQIYSNAIFNIAENDAKKNEILAILDTTPDTRIPCGGGIIVTMDRVIIQLGEAAAATNTRPKAVIYLDKFKAARELEVKKFMVKTKALEWITKDGMQHQYESSMYKYVSFDRIAQKLLPDLAAIYKEVYGNRRKA